MDINKYVGGKTRLIFIFVYRHNCLFIGLSLLKNRNPGFHERPHGYARACHLNITQTVPVASAAAGRHIQNIGHADTAQMCQERP
jgi:hypothetical protein